MKANDDDKQKVGDSPFCKRFEQFLAATDMNSNRLANRLNDSNPVKFRRWLAGDANPNANSLRPVADAFGVRIDWLLTGDGDMFTKSPDGSDHILGEKETDGYWKGRFDALENKYNKLAEDYRVLMGEYKALLEKTVRKLDPSLFSESDSHITVFPLQRNLIGYGRVSETECKIIPHPASVEREYEIVEEQAELMA